MKRILELNGVANMSLLLQCEVDKAQDAESGGNIYYMNEETYKSMKEQVELLERYMLAYHKAVRNNTQTPMWHEVREKPKLYPLNKETVD